MHLAPPRPVRIPGACFALACTVVLLPSTARSEESTPERLGRLGFRFDPKIHAAAAASTLEAEPPPPGVVRLPRYTHTERPIPLREYEMLTPEGRVAVAKKRFLTPMYQKTLGPLSAIAGLLRDPLRGWNPNTPEALALYEDAEQKRRNLEAADLVELGALADRLQKPDRARRSSAPPTPAR